MNLPVKPIDSWSRGSVAGRLLVEPTFESLHPTLPLEMEGRRLLVALTIESLHPTLSLEIEVSYRRLLVEPTFESLHPTLSLEVEVSSSRLLVEPTVESLHSTLSLEMEPRFCQAGLKNRFAGPETWLSEARPCTPLPGQPEAATKWQTLLADSTSDPIDLYLLSASTRQVARSNLPQRRHLEQPAQRLHRLN
ncbi:unnamed protein product [Protopolystoma xenopodis]|uniref:Uncharacterized protein n=1 Tax=Protopolystoma xenopodis TaxID=117903 RepID=A0A448XIJ0_9PLAT|nr:unnamed protein product [Protopolystoma xenopodis]